MKIYIDPCCYNRPFDDLKHMAQPRVRAEVDAVLNAVDICDTEGFDVIGSDAAVFEINKITNMNKLKKVTRFYRKTITKNAVITPEVKTRAAELMTLGVKELDSYHVALAESVEVDYLLTTDDRLEAAAERLCVKTKVVNPIKFMREYAIWLLRLT